MKEKDEVYHPEFTECANCRREFDDSEMRIWKGKKYCIECFIDLGISNDLEKE